MVTPSDDPSDAPIDALSVDPSDRSDAASGRRRALTVVAFRLAAREGLAAVGFATVAADAGVSEAEVASEFGELDELITALAGQVNRQLRAALHVPVGTGGRIEDFLLRGFRGLWRDIERMGPAATVANELAIAAARRVDFRRGSARNRSEASGAIGEFLGHAASATGCRWSVPVDQVTELVINALAGITMAFIVDRDRVSGRRRLETLARVLACAAVADRSGRG